MLRICKFCLSFASQQLDNWSDMEFCGHCGLVFEESAFAQFRIDQGL